MKKLLSLMLVLVMVLTMFVGCGKKAETPAEPDAAPAAPESTGKVEENAPAEEADDESWKEEHPTWLCEEKTTLTVSTWDRMSATMAIPSNDLRFWQWLEDYTNVHIEWEITPYTGYEEVSTTRLASGQDLADIVTLLKIEPAIIAGQNGLAVDMGQYWDTCLTNTDAYYEPTGVDFRSLVSDENGQAFGVLGSQNPKKQQITLLYNTEWMEKLGAEVPTTLDEFTDLLYKMKEAGDLNGNGDSDEIILTCDNLKNLSSGFYTAFGLSYYDTLNLYGVDENGIVYEDYTSESMREYLRWLNRLYEDGILDAEICNMTMDDLSQKVAADRVAVYPFWATFARTYGNMTTAGQAAPNEEHYTLGGALASQYNGNESYRVTRDLVADTRCSIVTSECENPELAIKWLDTLVYDPVVVRTMTIGWENEHWKFNDAGEIELLLVEDLVPYGCGQPPMPNIQPDDKYIPGMRPYVWMDTQYKERVEASKWVNHDISPVAGYTEEEQALLDMYQTDVLGYFQEMRDMFVTGQASLDTDWDSYKEAIYSLGLDGMIEMWQMVYDRTK